MAFSLKTRRWISAAVALGVPALCLVVYTYPPAETGFYPPCVFHHATGLHCPGCGTGRGLHALLHGELAQAWAYNPLSLILLPPLALWAVRAGVAAVAGWPSPALLPAWTHRVLLVVVLGFWLLRNVPVYPFTLLAPRALSPAATSVGE